MCLKIKSYIAYTTYSNTNIFGPNTAAATTGTWDPCTTNLSTFPNVCNASPLDIAVANLIGTKGSSTAVFNWNASWGIDGVAYSLERSTDNQASFTSIYSRTSSGIYDVNFTYTDNNPPAGSTYYYHVVASKSGLATHTTAVTNISSTPTTTAGTLGSFLQGLGTPSASQSYTLSAVNLLTDLTITPPANYQISLDAGTTWSAGLLSITPVSGTISSRTVAVRLNSTTAGTFSGNVSHTSSGAANVNVAVTGTVQNDPLPVSYTGIFSFGCQ